LEFSGTGAFSAVTVYLAFLAPCNLGVFLAEEVTWNAFLFNYFFGPLGLLYSRPGMVIAVLLGSFVLVAAAAMAHINPPKLGMLTPCKPCSDAASHDF
jgi:hypothetical protein